ncbi:unnamed protein product [[Candida] boidinii]|nr:unnamed protein product [[Candida] boidinii]
MNTQNNNPQQQQQQQQQQNPQQQQRSQAALEAAKKLINSPKVINALNVLGRLPASQRQQKLQQMVQGGQITREELMALQQRQRLMQVLPHLFLKIQITNK